MPQSTERLRKIFMTESSDGIMEAEKVITDFGGAVKNGIIYIDIPEGRDNELDDAIDFLCDEWDYSF